MKIDIFDKYDIRARICACVFIVSPWLIDGYIFVDELRSISTTIIITVVLLSLSCFLISWLRYCGNKIRQDDYIYRFLLPDSNELSSLTRTRYYRKLSEKESDFKTLLAEPNKETAQELCKSASKWLKSNTRNDELVKEENMNYGFIRNLYSIKKQFLCAFSIYTFFLIILLLTKYSSFSFLIYLAIIPGKHIACLLVHILFYTIWIFGITKKMLLFVSRKYALSVLSAIDNL